MLSSFSLPFPTHKQVCNPDFKIGIKKGIGGGEVITTRMCIMAECILLINNWCWIITMNIINKENQKFTFTQSVKLTVKSSRNYCSKFSLDLYSVLSLCFHIFLLDVLISINTFVPTLRSFTYMNNVQIICFKTHPLPL